MKNVVITGTSRGIGYELVQLYGAKNYNVICLTRDLSTISISKNIFLPLFFSAHAQDAGMPEWECVSQVIIEINDINDNAPIFDQKVFTASMREDTPIGAIALLITKLKGVLNANPIIE